MRDAFKSEVSLDLGITYTADRLKDDGSELSSAIDHIYASTCLNQSIEVYKLENGATDHVPIVADLKLKAPKEKKPRPKSIRKRVMKDFTKTRWIDCLRNQDWSKVYQHEDVEEKAEELTNQINAALDECAPYKLVKVRATPKSTPC